MPTTTKGLMHSPAHPGQILREMYLEPLRATVTDAAEALGVTRKHLSSIINERASVTPDMAMRLAVTFSTEAQLWINLQAQYDLWLVSQKAPPNAKPLKKAA